MDFTKFLNSKDIAEYLREVHYEFSPEEAAYVIHEARNISLSEKHAAYRELIARYPEFILEERNGDFATQPLAHFLEELIRREEEYVAECKTPSHDAAYAYDVYTVGSSGQPFWFEGGGRGMLYPSYEMCLSVVNEVECAVKIRISKQYIGRCEGVEVELLPDGTILAVTAWGKGDVYIEAFDWFWIALPTPFRRGDILRPIRERTSDTREEEVLVLEFMSTWGLEKLIENGFRDCGEKTGAERKRGELDFERWESIMEMRRYSGDVSDMILEGFELTQSGGIIWDTHAPYLDFELCRKVPKDKRALLPLSAFLKGEIGEDLLLNAYRYHVLKTAAAKAEENACSFHSRDGIALAGIGHEEEDEETQAEEGKDIVAKLYYQQITDEYYKFIDENNVRVKDAVEMHLAELPFEQIRSGKKTVEVRLCDEKRSAIEVGDDILFYNEDGTEWIRAQVTALHRAPTFAQLFAMPDMLEKAGFADMPLTDAVIWMHQYYTPEQETSLGVLGIELRKFDE